VRGIRGGVVAAAVVAAVVAGVSMAAVLRSTVREVPFQCLGCVGAVLHDVQTWVQAWMDEACVMVFGQDPDKTIFITLNAPSSRPDLNKIRNCLVSVFL